MINNKIIIDGIFFSNQYMDSWIIKSGEQYYSIPTQVLQSKYLDPIDLSSGDMIRPVGQNVEKLLLAKSDMVSKNIMPKSVLVQEKNSKPQSYQTEL